MSVVGKLNVIFRTFKQYVRCLLGGQVEFFDEWPRLLAVFFVVPLSTVSYVRPEHIVFLGFLCRSWAAYLIFTQNSDMVAGVFLLIGLLLDYVDGQLARLTGRVTSVGGLLDLMADFFATLCLFVAVGSRLSGFSAWHVGLVVLGLWSCYCSSSLLSFYRWAYRGGQKKMDVRTLRQFLALPHDDRAQFSQVRGYGRAYVFLNSLMSLTWCPVLNGIFRSRFLGPCLLPRSAIHLLAVGSLGVNLSVLAVFLLCSLSLSGFFLYQISMNLIILAVVFCLSRSFSRADGWMKSEPFVLPNERDQRLRHPPR